MFCVADYFTFLSWTAINKVTNKARFILRTPTDAIYISSVAAITSDCLFCYAAGSINTATRAMLLP